MEMRDLEYFEVIARTQNLGQAAELIGRTKPALTKCIRRLEDGLGTSLFVRSGRGITLTAVGRMLRDRAGELRSHAGSILREVHDFAEGTAGHVRIGLGATPAQEILPNITADLIASMPDVTIEIVIGINNVLRDALRSGDLDLVVGPVGDRPDPDFVTHVLLDDEVVVVARQDHPMLGHEATLEELAACRWVLPVQPATQRKWLDDVFVAHKLPPPQVQIETNSLYLLPALIAQTQLLSFMPRRHLWPRRPDVPLREIKLPAATMVRNFGVSYREHAYLPPAALRLVDLLRQDGHRRRTAAASAPSGSAGCAPAEGDPGCAATPDPPL